MAPGSMWREGEGLTLAACSGRRRTSADAIPRSFNNGNAGSVGRLRCRSASDAVQNLPALDLAPQHICTGVGCKTHHPHRRRGLGEDVVAASEALTRIGFVPRGVGSRIAAEFAEYRPWRTWAQFDREIGK